MISILFIIIFQFSLPHIYLNHKYVSAHHSTQNETNPPYSIYYTQIKGHIRVIQYQSIFIFTLKHLECFLSIVTICNFLILLFFCTSEILACASSPCQNGATCFDHNGGSGYACLCPAGFEGTNCENGTLRYPL